MRIALSALDSGRLGIAACATGLAQAALDLRVDYAGSGSSSAVRSRSSRGCSSCSPRWRPRSTPARATYLHGGPEARRRPAVHPGAAVAKLVATDAAMRVTTDAVQVLGGYGYTPDFPAERYLREARSPRSSRGPTRSSGW